MRNSNPKRILVFPFNLMSHYLRCIELVKRFPNSEILFASSSAYNQFVIEQGLRLFEVDAFDEKEVVQCSKEFDFSWLNYNDIYRVYKDQIRVIKELSPDVVIGDVAPTLKMAAEKCGVEYWSLMNGYMTPYYKYVRKLSIRHKAYKHLKDLPESLSDKITSFAEKIAFKIVHKPFKKIRRQEGLSTVKSYMLETQGDYNFVCDSEDLFPQTDLPRNYEIIGNLNPIINKGEVEDLSDFNRPTIVLTMGSSGDWSFWEFLYEKEFEKYNIIKAGYNEKSKAKHVRNIDFVDLDELLKSTRLLICHGGNGTIYKGLRSGVTIFCKTSIFEQEWNVHALERIGKGVNLDQLNKDEIIEQIELALSSK